MEWVKYLPSPSTLNIGIFPETIVDMIMEDQRKIVDQYTRDMLCSVPKYTITPDGCKCEWHIGDIDFVKKMGKDDCLLTVEAWNQFNKTNNEKEKEKMEAKKCERCGKLYEMQDVENYIAAYFPGFSVSDWDKENYSDSRIRKNNTRIISVNFRSGQVVDLCPECREKLKEFFESGEDETHIIKKSEEN